MTIVRLLRVLIQAIWPHLQPSDKEILVAWARKDHPEHPVIDEMVGAILDCNLDEDPAFQAMLVERLREAIRVREE